MENRLKDECRHIEIPKELDDRVREGIRKGMRASRLDRIIKNIILGAAASLVLGISVMGVGVNASPVFAEAMNNIPMLSPIAKIMTLSRYRLEDETVELDVEIPEISGLNDVNLEERINQEILRRVRAAEIEIQERAEEYKRAYLETGGNEEDYRPTQAQVGYEVNSVGDKYLSFTVYQFESRASAYTDFTYYNFDLEMNRELTLEDLIGENYMESINEQISKKIEIMKRNPENIFFEGDMGFVGIREDQGFYINEANQVVVCFDKYEIAPGYMGILEFVIE